MFKSKKSWLISLAVLFIVVVLIVASKSHYYPLVTALHSTPTANPTASPTAGSFYGEIEVVSNNDQSIKIHNHMSTKNSKLTQMQIWTDDQTNHPWQKYQHMFEFATTPGAKCIHGIYKNANGEISSEYHVATKPEFNCGS